MINVKETKKTTFARRCTAGFLAVCIVLSLTGVGLFIETIISMLSVKASAANGVLRTDPSNMSVGDHIVFTDAMDAQSTTVFFSHWHLQVIGDTLSANADNSRDEFRFYPYSENNKVTKVYLFAKITNINDIAEHGNMYIGDKIVSGEDPKITAEKQANEFELVKVFDITDDNYDNVKFVISPQTTNPIKTHMEGNNIINPAREKFSNFSISSGHDSANSYLRGSEEYKALEDKNIYGVVMEEDLKKVYSDNIPDNYARMEITYHPDSVNHIIKGHVFYVNDVVKMVGADFANKTHFTLPVDDKEYNTEANADNDKVKNPYYDENEDLITYTGEIDTYAYSYKDEDDKDKVCVYYNTSAGLHTNKTATVTEGDTSGRLFDVSLETWYAGEDLADVGFILDASGSMAWTTDVLKPLEVDVTLGEAIGTGKYLTNEQLDQILNTANTDNTHISYSEYNYYVYIDRSSIDEFAPIGYWGGNLEPKKVVKPGESINYNIIGYYPFDENLINAITGNTSAQVVQKDTFTPAEGKIELPAPQPSYGQEGIALKETAENGAILLDVAPDSYPFSISFDVNVGTTSFAGTNSGGSDPFDETPIMYIGTTDATSFYRIVRGNKRDRNGSRGSQNLRLYANSYSQPANEGGVIDGSAKGIDITDDKNALPLYWNKFFEDTGVITCTLVFTEEGNMGFYTSKSGSPDTLTNNIIDANKLDFSKGIQLIIGGNVCEDKTTYSDVYVKNVKVYNKALSGLPTAQDNGNLIGSYSLDGTLENSVPGTSAAATFIDQYANGSFDTAPQTGEMVDISNAVQYETGFGGEGNSLNLTKSTNLVGILLDATPKSNDFTVSFAVKGAAANAQKNIMYISGYNSETNKFLGANYRLRHELNKDHLRFDVEKPGAAVTANVTNETKVFDNTWNVVTMTVKDAGNNKSTITLYLNGNLGVHGSNKEGNPVSVVVDTDALSGDVAKIILGALVEEYGSTNDIYLDELYIMDRALSDTEVNSFYAEKFGGDTNSDEPTGKTNPIAYDDNGNVIAYVGVDVKNVPKSKLKGWYYVNSGSKWKEFINNSDAATAKEFQGFRNDANIDSKVPNDKDGLTYQQKYVDRVEIPKPYKDDEVFLAHAKSGDEQNVKFVNPTNTADYGPIKFFLTSATVDGKTKYYLRCYFNDGQDSSTSQDDPRTHCSYVYYKADNQRIKSESLQYVLASFTANLLDQSPRSRISATRFSLSPTGYGDDIGKGDLLEGESGYNEKYLDLLTLLDWTKSNDDGIVSARRGGKDYNNGDSTMGFDRSKPNMKDETSKSDTIFDPNEPINQYNYFLTGGTYTWTGLKSFYTQLAKHDTRYYEGAESVEKPDKYVILFTDGRDNTVSGSLSSATDIKNLVVGKAGTTANSDYKYNENAASLSNAPAKIWADKLKEDGYTVFVVMLASGSVSEQYNPSEYNTALAFVSHLIAGPAYEEKDTDKDGKITDKDLQSHYDPDDDRASYVFVAKNDAELSQKFNIILDRISSGLPHYTVQDFIDPRFDLVEELQISTETDENGTPNDKSDDTVITAVCEHTIYLGAEGNIRILPNYNNQPPNHHVTIRLTNNGVTKVYERDDWWQIHEYVQKLKETECMYAPAGLTDTLSDDDSIRYQALDGKTARLYYHDETREIDPDPYTNGEDMYYLRWLDTKIPGCAEGAPLVEIWRSDIRLRAKEDFIGGNSILTNGNLEHMNYVYTTEKDESDKRELSNSSGTDKANPKLELDNDNNPKYLPSKGFPRVTVDVRLLPITTQNLSKEIYMGEAISPAQLLLDVEGQYVTDSYYLEYLKRYAYQRYMAQGKESEELLKDQNNAALFTQYTNLSDAYRAAKESYNDALNAIDNLDTQINRYETLIKNEPDEGKKAKLIAEQDVVKANRANKEQERDDFLDQMNDYKSQMEQLVNANEGLKTIVLLHEQMDMPLLELLNEWLHINDARVTPKSFSIPYIYLSSVSFDSEGYILTYEGGPKAKDNPGAKIRYKNSAGALDTNQRDVVGILTYKWEELDPFVKPATAKDSDPTKEYVKDDTERVMYSLTVEFTPLYNNDMPTYVTSRYPDYSSEDNFEVDIVPSSGGKFALKYKGGVNGFFSDFLGIEDDNIVADTEDELFDYFSRLASNNGTLPSKNIKVDDVPDNHKKDGLIRESQDINKFNIDRQLDFDRAQYDDPTFNKLVKLNTNVYRWDKNYKPTPGQHEPGDLKQLEYVGLEGEDNTKPYIIINGEAVHHYGDATVKNMGANGKFRTITARSEYTKDVVSGGVALELRVPVGDLKKELTTEEESERSAQEHEADPTKPVLETGGYYERFTLQAKRQYTDTDYIEGLKNKGKLSNYAADAKFTLSFEFNYTKKEIDALIKNKANDAYVSIFARTTEGGISTSWTNVTLDQDGNISNSVTHTTVLHELPIGTYTFELDDVSFAGGKNTFNSKLFNYIGAEKDKEVFKQTLPYTSDEHSFDNASILMFDQYVLNGLWTTKEPAGDYNNEDNKKNYNDRIYQSNTSGRDELIFTKPEIDKNNVTKFVADTKQQKQKSDLGKDDYESASVTFYFGTNSSNKNGASGTVAQNQKTIKYSEVYPECYPDTDSYPDDYYINDRLGIIVLSIGDNELTIKKTVENTKDEQNLNELWSFNIVLKSKTQFTDTNNYTAKYIDLDDVDAKGHRFFDDKGNLLDCDCCRCIANECPACDANGCNCEDKCECADCGMGKNTERVYDFYDPDGTGKKIVERMDGNNYPKKINFLLQNQKTDPVTGEALPNDDGYYVYIATIKLKHRQQIKIIGLGGENDGDIFYEVTENINTHYNDGDYSAEFLDKNGNTIKNNGQIITTVSGTIEPGGSVIDCHNKFVKVLFPATGGTGTRRFVFVGCCLTIFAAALLLYLYYLDSKSKQKRRRAR